MMTGNQIDMTGSAAIVLAAGLSRRMGAPKMLLPWGEITIIEQSITNLLTAGVQEIIVVIGGFKEKIEPLLHRYPVRLAFNPDYENGEMLFSAKVGLRALSSSPVAVFLALGDQPGIQPEIITRLWQFYAQNPSGIVFPSFNYRRGHPWLISRNYWPDILELTPPQTLRDFLKTHQAEIRYFTVETDSILQDLDTPEDYKKFRDLS